MARGTSTAIIVRRTATIAIAAAAAAALAACGAGQVTQTDQKQTAIAGVNTDSPSGDLALRDLQVEFESPEGYEAGENAPLRVWIANESDETIHLTGVTTEAADETVTIVPAGTPWEPEEQPTETEAPAEEETTEGTEEETTEGSEDEQSEDETAEETETPADDEQATEEPAEGEEDAAGESGFIGSEDIDVEIAPGEFVNLAHETGEQYLLVENLADALASGQSLTVTFEFDNGDTFPVNIPMGQALDADEDDFEFQENPGAGGH